MVFVFIFIQDDKNAVQCIASDLQMKSNIL